MGVDSDDTDDTSIRSCETSVDPWPSLQHGPANHGYARHGATPSPSDREFVREDTPDGTGPVIGESRVYVPTDDGILALDRSNEEIVWRHELENPAAATQALGCGRVYVQTTRRLLALDQRDGSVAWTFDRGYGVASPNLSTGSTGLVVPTTNRVFKLTHAGEVSWQSEELSNVVGGLAVADGRVFVTTSTESGSALHAIDVASGDTLWSTTGTESQTWPVVSDGRVFVSRTDGKVRAFAVDNGTSEWTSDVGGQSVYEPLALDPERGTLYVPTGSRGGLVALDAVDGTEQWRAEVADRIDYPPVTDGETVYVPGKTVTAVDAGDGTIQWRLDGLAGNGFAALSPGALWLVADDSLIRVPVTE